MRKRVICRTLALAMAAMMAVPQAGVTTMAATKVTKTQASAKDAKELKTGVEITKAEVSKNWKDEVLGVVFPEVSSYGSEEVKNYCVAVEHNGSVTVNGVAYTATYDEEDETKVYECNYRGLQIGTSAFVEGTNTVVIKAEGYKDKTVVFTKSGDTYTFVSQKDGEDSTDPTPTPHPTPSIENPKEDGTYTVAFKANKAGTEEESMLAGYFEPKAKLEVKNGEMTLSILNVQMANYLTKFSLGLSDGAFTDATRTGYGEANSKGEYDAYEYSMKIDDITKAHTAKVTISAMGGMVQQADITFTSVTKGWKGYEKKDGKQVLVDALIGAGCDTNDDGEISSEELADFSGDGGVLDLSNCGLTDISLLKGLSDKITTVELTGNKITEIPEGLFDNMTNLTTVYLGNNYISKLPENLFKNNKKVENIELSNNKLTEIKKDDFSNLPQLQIIQMEDNNIEKIEEGAFDGDVNLQSIYAPNNELEGLPKKLFKDMKSLTFVDFSNNYFSELPECFSDATKLKKIHVRNNEMTDITKVDFSNMLDLEEINFYKNYIKEVPDGTFANNTKLFSVDLHDNQISDITEKAFANKLENDYDGKLHKLDLTLNNIKVVDPAVMKKSDITINKFYPQKSAMNLTLKKDADGNLTWSQDLSVLDITLWFDKTASDEAREIETVDDYKTMLEKNDWADKNIADVMSEKYNWDIVTEVQEKNADGTWKTVKEMTETDQAEALNGTYKVDDKGIYRISKVLYATLNGTKQYRMTVYSNELNLAEDTTNKPTEPTTEKKDQTTTATKDQTTTATNNKVIERIKTVLSKVTNLKVKNKKNKKAVITWKKVKNADGYQIYRATKKSGKFKKIKTVKGNRVVKYTNTKLKKNKKYYYKVRAYRTVKRKKAYGAFSTTKKIVVKK